VEMKPTESESPPASTGEKQKRTKTTLKAVPRKDNARPDAHNARMSGLARSVRIDGGSVSVIDAWLPSSEGVGVMVPYEWRLLLSFACDCCVGGGADTFTV
jgi:hypothetical protein